MWLRGVVGAGCALALVSPSMSAQASAALQLAKAGVLKRSDLPGFSAQSTKAEPEDAADERALYKCLGAKVPTFAARNLGLVFTKDAVQIDSSADVLTPVSKAKADLKLQASACGRGPRPAAHRDYDVR